MSPASSLRYVIALLGEERYAIPMEKVQEFSASKQLTRIPKVPAFIKGLINLRGQVLPVIDLGLKLGLAPREDSKFDIILIVEVDGRRLGLQVSGVAELLDIQEEAIQETPDFSSRLQTAFVRGICHIKDELVILLDIDRLLSREEIEALDVGD